MSKASIGDRNYQYEILCECNTRVMSDCRSVVSDSVTPWTVATRLLCLWNSPGKHTGVGCHALLQGIFLTQGSNPGLLYCRQILYQLSHRGSVCIYTIQ